MTSILKPANPPATISIAAGVAVILLMVDQFTKSIIVNNYLPNQVIAALKGVSLVYVTNSGGICGYGQGAGALLTVIGFLTTALIIIAIPTLMPNTLLYAAAFGMLLAGATGNLIDRLRFGYVVDFITLDLRLLRWPSFNIADTSIVAGITLIGLLTWWEAKQESRHTPRGSTIVFLVIAVLVLAAAYLFCVWRPFG